MTDIQTTRPPITPQRREALIGASDNFGRGLFGSIEELKKRIVNASKESPSAGNLARVDRLKVRLQEAMENATHHAEAHARLIARLS